MSIMFAAMKIQNRTAPATMPPIAPPEIPLPPVDLGGIRLGLESDRYQPRTAEVIIS